MFLKQLTLFTLIMVNLFMAVNSYAAEKLVFAIDLIRHGDRTPVRELPKSPYHWQQGLGELTAEGMHQEFQLGKQLRKKYIEQNALLPTQYQVETLYVRSSDYNRTLMSADSLLLGLYPLETGPLLSGLKKHALPSGYQPIPIHTVPQDQDNLFISDKNRERYETALRDYVFTQKEWQEKSNAMQEKLKQWSQLSGLSLNNLYKVVTLANVLYIRQLHHVSFPKGMTPQDAKEIIATGIWAFTTAYKTKEITYPVGHAMLAAIANYFQQASEQKTKLKYVLFSGHDTTIMSVLNTLGTPLDSWPHYASDLNFSLYENNKHYFVKINFNNNAMNIPACGSNTCTLEQFIQLAKK